MAEGFFVSLIFAGIGALTVVAGVLWYISVRNFRRRASRTTGVLTELHPDGVPALLRTALTVQVIEFVDAEGQRRQIPWDAFTGGLRRARAGDPVPVLFDPHNPVKARVDGGTVLPALVVGIGLVFVAISLPTMFAGGALALPQLREGPVRAEWTTGRIMFIAMFGGMGGLMALIGYLQLYGSLRLVLTGVRTAGIVVEHEMERSARHSGPGYNVFHYPVVEFKDQTGAARRKRMSVGTGGVEHAEGYAVEILYDPAHPERAKIATFSQLWALGLMMSVLGTLSAGIALIVWYFGVEVTGP